jgi:hypothetical protein
MRAVSANQLWIGNARDARDIAAVHGEVGMNSITPDAHVVLTFVAAVVLAAVAARADDRSDETLKQIVEHIRENERLYRNLEFTQTTRHEQASPPHPPGFVQRMWQVHDVRRNERFLLEVAEASVRDPARTEHTHRLLTFDGTTMHFLGHGSDENALTSGGMRQLTAAPHTRLLLRTEDDLPLSQRLCEPATQVTHLGIGSLDGLECEKILLGKPRRPSDDILVERELWLAKDRNYLPIQVLTFELRHSTLVPCVVAVVEELREIERGVWFPWSAMYRRYDRLHLERTGEQRLGWRETIVTQSATLNPDHPDTYFSDISSGRLTLAPQRP